MLEALEKIDHMYLRLYSRLEEVFNEFKVERDQFKVSDYLKLKAKNGPSSLGSSRETPREVPKPGARSARN